MSRQAGGKLLYGDLGPKTTIIDIEAAIASRWWKKDGALHIGGLVNEPLASVYGFRVGRVDGEWIRNNLDTTFGTGGHGLVHTFIPLREVWVDPVSEEPFSIAFHEIIEFHYMMDRGMDYRAAHGKALEDQEGLNITSGNIEVELSKFMKNRVIERMLRGV